MSWWKNKKVLVTGGAGFLGTSVVKVLREAGCNEITIIRGKDYDLTQETEIIRLFEKHRPEVVFHLAGLVGGILANKERPAEFFYQNLMMGTLMLHYAWKAGVQRFVAAGAGCGYPEEAPMPLKESSFWSGFPQKESAPYGLAKRMLQIQAQAYFQQYGLVSVIGLPGNVYGPHDNYDLYQGHVIPALIQKFVESVEEKTDRVIVWGSGKPSRDFVYVEDVARGLVLAAEKYEFAELVNLSSGQETTIRQVVDLLVDLTDFSGKVIWETSKPDGQLRRVFDVTKAKEDLGFEARVSLPEGLRRTVEWYKAHRGRMIGGRVRT